MSWDCFEAAARVGAGVGLRDDLDVEAAGFVVELEVFDDLRRATGLVLIRVSWLCRRDMRRQHQYRSGSATHQVVSAGSSRSAGTCGNRGLAALYALY
jgi:hypothetical protein